MRNFYVFATIIALSLTANTANAESYFDKLLQQKREAAERTRQASFQHVQARQADPEGYMRAKHVSFTKNAANVETFDVAGDGHYYMPVTINGGSIDFMADTGASGIFISQSDAKKAGINTQTLQYNQRYVTANGATGRAAITTARRLEVGSIEMSNVPVIVSMEQQHVALLGMEFFSRLKRYEVSEGKMSLYE